jgi:hypothetical protein
VSEHILPLSVLLYLSVPAWMGAKGWPIRAGVAMITFALLPWVVWLFHVDEPFGPGAGVAMLATGAMLFIALLPLGYGLFRMVSRPRSQ